MMVNFIHRDLWQCEQKLDNKELTDVQLVNAEQLASEAECPI
jgi:hypothetical protein